MDQAWSRYIERHGERWSGGGSRRRRLGWVLFDLLPFGRDSGYSLCIVVCCAGVETVVDVFVAMEIT